MEEPRLIEVDVLFRLSPNPKRLIGRGEVISRAGACRSYGSRSPIDLIPEFISIAGP